MSFRNKIFLYVKSFGLGYGLYLFFKVRRSDKKEIISFNLPGLPQPVFLRRQGSDFMVFEEVFIDQHYRTGFPEAKIKTIIDAGANIGLSTLYFLTKYPTATIVCIEPEESNFELLQKNLRGYERVIMVKKALWHSNQSLDIVNDGAASWGFEIICATDGPGHIEGISLDQLIADYHLPGIDLLKIDIEGSEKEVFETNTGWIEKVNYAVVEIHDDMRKGAYRSVMDLMKRYKFKSVRNKSLYLFFK